MRRLRRHLGELKAEAEGAWQLQIVSLSGFRGWLGRRLRATGGAGTGAADCTWRRAVPACNREFAGKRPVALVLLTGLQDAAEIGLVPRCVRGARRLRI
jgi:hypothetical protein